LIENAKPRKGENAKRMEIMKQTPINTVLSRFRPFAFSRSQSRSPSVSHSPCLRVSSEHSERVVNPKIRPRRPHGARLLPGTSLVEILVVLVILVIGIFSLVRLFPVGFSSILYGENVTRGSALTKSELERLRSASINLPDAIGPINPVNGTVDVALDPGAELLPFQPDPKLPEDPRFSDLNHYRRVWGETAKIPAPTSECAYMPLIDSATGRREPVSLYTLQFSPIYSTRRLLAYGGTPLERMVLEGAPQSDDELRAFGDTRYGIDYRNAILYFAPAPFARRFKLDYSYTIPQAGNQFFRANSVPDSCIFVGPSVTRFNMREAHKELPADCRFI
ncbi:MAG: hypothetical protein HY248_04115, partial [Fimbriimonas ginsengisoli]|nr:hypothetical protein [Fimbriimonas ginsengisoli]